MLSGKSRSAAAPGTKRRKRKMSAAARARILPNASIPCSGERGPVEAWKRFSKFMQEHISTTVSGLEVSVPKLCPKLSQVTGVVAPDECTTWIAAGHLLMSADIGIVRRTRDQRPREKGYWSLRLDHSLTCTILLF